MAREKAINRELCSETLIFAWACSAQRGCCQLQAGWGKTAPLLEYGIKGYHIGISCYGLLMEITKLNYIYRNINEDDGMGQSHWKFDILTAQKSLEQLHFQVSSCHMLGDIISCEKHFGHDSWSNSNNNCYAIIGNGGGMGILKSDRLNKYTTEDNTSDDTPICKRNW